jgi:AbrB family looped-hinge helix DNA binding protein
MALAHSKLTAQGQISVPAEIRKRLGIVPGSVIEWDEDGGKIVVRRKGKYSSEDIRRVLFPEGPPKRVSLKEMKEAIGRGIGERYTNAIRRH